MKEQGLFELVPMLDNSNKVLRHSEPPWLQIFNSLVFLCSNNLMGLESFAHELLQIIILSGFLINMEHILSTRGPTVKIFARHLLFVALGVKGSEGIESIRLLLRSGVSPNSTDPNDYGCSALQKAVKERNRDAVQLLLELGADPNGMTEGTDDNTLMSPLNYALYLGGDRELAQMLIDSGADVNSGFQKPLVIAVRKGDLVLVKHMLEAGADLKMLPAEGLSVLYFAIERQDLSLVNTLIEAGVNQNLSIDELEDEDMQFLVHELGFYDEARIITPLHYAVLFGDVGIVKRLIEGGAIMDKFIDPGMITKTNGALLTNAILTPLQIAVQESKGEITKILLDAGAGVDFRHPATGTALQLACSSKMEEGEKIDLARVLLAKGADINSLPGEPAGRTAMQAAAESGNRDLLKLLLRQGGNLFAPATKENGLTVFQAALRSGSAELVTYVFWELGSSCSWFSFFDGANYLEEAVSTGNLQLLETVLKFWNHHELHLPKEFISSALKTAVRSGFLYHILSPDAGPFTIRSFTIPEEDVSSLICESIWNVGIADTRTSTSDSGQPASVWTRDARVFGLLMQRCIRPNLDYAQPGYPTPLWLAMHQGEYYMAKRLLKAGANPNKPSLVVCRNRCCHDAVTEMPLKQAICRFDNKFIELLINNGANIHCLIDGSLTPLLVSLQRRNEDATVFLLSQGADPNVTDVSGRYTALGFAVNRISSLSTMQSLISHGSDVNIPSVWGTPLEQVAGGDSRQHDTIQRCRLLLEAGADVNAYIGSTALNLAVTSGHVELAKLLINAGADVNASKPGMTTPLQVAVENNNTDLAILLIGSGAGLNSSSAQTSALQLAVSNNNLELAVLLLAEGADVNDSTTGKTVLQSAASLGNLELVKHLIDKGANVDAKVPGSLTTALQYAAMHGNVEIVKYLVEHGASVNEEASPFYEGTALGLAISNGHTKAAIYLIEKGASIEERPTTDGETLLQLAAKHGNHEIVTCLVENGAAVNAAPATKRGATALQFAAINGNIKTAVFLLENGAYISAKGADIDGRTALQGAAEHGRLDMVHLLLYNDEEPDSIEERCHNAAEFAEAEHHYAIARLLREYKVP
jgi:ankyrin repeat protein